MHIARGDQRLFVVCDGMGGAAAGEVASRIAAETIVHHLSHVERREMPTAGTGRLLPHTAHLVDAVRQSNAAIYRQAKHNEQQAEMGTTVVSAFIDRSIAGVAHVGDSRAYLWYDGRLVRLTADHSLAGSDHVLIRALGRQPDVDVAVSEVPLQAGDYLLLCSDGLTRMVSDDLLADAIARVRDPQGICDDLTEAAIGGGGTDNITVIVIQVLGSWRQRVSMRWRRQTGGAHDGAVHRHA